MPCNWLKRTLPLLAVAPLVLAAQQATPSEPSGPTADQVYKNIQVFKGVPAKDLIPSMEFMAASLKAQCSFCHDKDDYSKDTRAKDTARKMILMVRDINQRHFGDRRGVTCMSCHNGHESPSSTPAPEGLKFRHDRLTGRVDPNDLIKKHLAAVGPDPVALVRTGTLTTPPESEGKDETKPLQMIQAKGGQFVVSSDGDKFGSDGSHIWRNGIVMQDEPAAIFDRMGRSWRGQDAFMGLDNLSATGKETVGKSTSLIIRGTRTATGSTEELWFDEKSGLLTRFVNRTPSTMGTVVSVFDYLNWKTVAGVKVPMKIVVTFAGGERWVMDFRSAKVETKVDSKLFAPPQ